VATSDGWVVRYSASGISRTRVAIIAICFWHCICLAGFMNLLARAALGPFEHPDARFETIDRIQDGRPQHLKALARLDPRPRRRRDRLFECNPQVGAHHHGFAPGEPAGHTAAPGGQNQRSVASRTNP